MSPPELPQRPGDPCPQCGAPLAVTPAQEDPLSTLNPTLVRLRCECGWHVYAERGGPATEMTA